jgi:hypothetical protein
MQHLTTEPCGLNLIYRNSSVNVELPKQKLSRYNHLGQRVLIFFAQSDINKFTVTLLSIEKKLFFVSQVLKDLFFSLPLDMIG